MRFGRAVVVNGRRAAGKDQTFGRFRVNSIDGRVERKNFAVNARFSDAPRDELCVLRSEVKYYYGFMILGHGLERVSDYTFVGSERKIREICVISGQLLYTAEVLQVFQVRLCAGGESHLTSVRVVDSSERKG